VILGCLAAACQAWVFGAVFHARSLAAEEAIRERVHCMRDVVPHHRRFVVARLLARVGAAPGAVFQSLGRVAVQASLFLFFEFLLLARFFFRLLRRVVKQFSELQGRPLDASAFVFVGVGVGVFVGVFVGVGVGAFVSGFSFFSGFRAVFARATRGTLTPPRLDASPPQRGVAVVWAQFCRACGSHISVRALAFVVLTRAVVPVAFFFAHWVSEAAACVAGVSVPLARALTRAARVGQVARDHAHTMSVALWIARAHGRLAALSFPPTFAFAHALGAHTMP